MKFLSGILFVGAGGFIGAISRYLLADWLHRFAGTFWFPTGTLSVNVIGCFLIGLLGGWSENVGILRPELRLLFIAGFLGSFTTFSTFGYEALTFVRHREFLMVLFHVGLHLILGMICVYGGYQLSLKLQG